MVVINDASDDNTSSIVKAAGFSVIDLSSNLGIGGAMQTGYLYAYNHDYDIAVQLDGDGQHDPIYIERLVAPIIQDEADMVIGSRFIEYDGFQSTRLRRMGIEFFKSIISLLTGEKFTDPTSGFRACNKVIIEHFAHYYPFDYPEPETLVMMLRAGYRLLEIPVIMRERAGGHSSIQSLKSLYYMIKVTMAIMIEMIKSHDVKEYENDRNETTVFSDNS